MATRGGFPVLRWQSMHAGGTPSLPAAAVFTDGGGLVRLRNNAGSLEVAITAAPGSPGATFDDWTAIGTVSAGSPVAIAAAGSELAAMSCSAGGASIDVRSSSDGGATWSPPTNLMTESGGIAAIAVAASPGGDMCLFAVPSGSPDVKRLRRTGGSWAASATTWTRSSLMHEVNGVAACHDGADYVLIVTGSDVATAAPGAWSTRMGDGGIPADAWSGLTQVASADAGSTVTFGGPALTARGGDFFGLVTRYESGHVAAAETLQLHPLHLAGSTSAWTEPAPIFDAGAGPLAWAGITSGAAWAASCAEVLRAEAPEEAEIGAGLVSAEWQIGLTSARAQLSFDAAIVASLGAEGLLRPGNSLTLHHGYASGSGGATELGLATTFTVASVEHRLDRGRAQVVVEARGAWEELARWHAPDSWQAPAGSTRDAIAARLTACAGVPLSVAAGVKAPPAEWASDEAAFVLTPGESGSTALRRLLLGLDMAAVATGAGLQLRGFGPTEPAAWQLGGENSHPVTSLVEAEQRSDGWVRLSGPGRYADAFDGETEPAAGVIHDASATTDALATAHAAAIFGQAGRLSGAIRLRLAFHAGIEPGDVVTVTDAADGLDGATRRVTAVGMDYRRGPAGARYDTLLTVEALS